MMESDDHDEAIKRKEEIEKGVAKLLDKLFRIVYSRTLDVDLARELVQEAAFRLHRRMNTQDWSQDIKSFDAYATRIVVNCLKDHWKKAKGKRRWESLDANDEKLLEEVNEALSSKWRFTSVDDDDMDLQKLHAGVLQQLLDGLDEHEQYLLELYRVDEWSLEEIAAITGESVGSVQHQLRKIHARLRQRAIKYKKASGKKTFF